ncbi:MAG: heme biosynthesis protein HemY [Jatrophihabitantaceae bacterium]
MGDNEEERDAAAKPTADSQRFKRLPERVKLEDTVESKDTNIARDPEGGRDTDRDFMFRHLGG